MSQQNEALVRRMFDEAWSRGNLDVVDDCVATDAVEYDPAETLRGPQGQKDMITRYRTAFPDCRLEILEMLSTGDRVVTRFRYSGTQRGQLGPIAPTNRQVSGEGIVIHRCEKGRIVEGHSQWDQLGMLQQLGVVTLPGQTRAAGA